LAIAGSRPTVASKGQNRGLASPSLRPDQKKQAPVPGAPCTGAPGFRSKVARQSKQGASPWPVLRRPAGGGSIRRQAATRTMSGTPKQIRKRLQKSGGSDQERTVRLLLGAPLNDAGKGTQNWAPMRCQTQGGAIAQTRWPRRNKGEMLNNTAWHDGSTTNCTKHGVVSSVVRMGPMHTGSNETAKHLHICCARQET